MIRCAGSGAETSDSQGGNRALCEIARIDARLGQSAIHNLRDFRSDNYREAVAHLEHAAALIQTVETSNERLSWLIEECLQLVKKRAV